VVLDCLELSIGRKLGSPAVGLHLLYLISSELIGVMYREEKICFRAPNCNNETSFFLHYRGQTLVKCDHIC